ncbi:MAG: DUF1192 domain-containing protein [Pseudomonadota bacterium]
MFDDLEPQKKAKPYALGDKLDDFSVEELVEIKTRLTDEISRIDAEMTGKQASLDAAANLFKK